jgi:hypothetical protein
VYKYRNTDTPFVCNFLGKAVFKNAIYKREWFQPTERAPFENATLRIPKNITEFLKFRFDDYMKPPSADRIKWEQHAWKWDCEKDFKEFCAGCTSQYRDEVRLL